MARKQGTTVQEAPPKPAKAPRPVYRTADGTRVPSVTTVLGVIAKPWLVAWANKLGLQGIDSTRYVDDTATIGTLAHAWVEHHLRGEKFPRERMTEYSDEQVTLARNSWAAYLAWRKAHDVEPVLIEAQLVSERMRVGGTVDLYARVDGRLEVIDLKTSARVYESHTTQLAAYRSLLEEAGHQVDAVRVVLLPREPLLGKHESERVVDDTTHELDVFRAARALYEAQRVMEASQRRNQREAKKKRDEAIEQAIQWDRFKD